jgi:hypothetical protein
MAHPQSLAALRQSLKELEHRLSQIEQQSQLSRADIDLLLQRIRELYEQGLDLQEDKGQSVEPASNALNTEPEAGQSADPSTKPAYSQEVSEPVDPSPVTDPDKVESNTSQPASEPVDPENKEDPDRAAEPEEVHAEAQTPEPPAEEHAENPSRESQTAAEELSTEVNNEKAEQAKEAPGAEGIPGGNASSTINEQGAYQSRAQAIHEKFEGQRPSLHEQLIATNQERSLADRFKNAPISDLRSAIGLNERANFIRDLFQGDREAYFRTLEQLNAAHDYQEAVVYLENRVKEAYGWNEQHETVQAFMELVYRRFLESARQT